MCLNRHVNLIAKNPLKKRKPPTLIDQKATRKRKLSLCVVHKQSGNGSGFDASMRYGSLDFSFQKGEIMGYTTYLSKQVSTRTGSTKRDHFARQTFTFTRDRFLSHLGYFDDQTMVTGYIRRKMDDVKNTGRTLQEENVQDEGCSSFWIALYPGTAS